MTIEEAQEVLETIEEYTKDISAYIKAGYNFGDIRLEEDTIQVLFTKDKEIQECTISVYPD